MAGRALEKALENLKLEVRQNKVNKIENRKTNQTQLFGTGNKDNTIIQNVKNVISGNLDIFIIDVLLMNFLALILIIWTLWIVCKYKKVLQGKR